jgi:hypothetical protein
VIGCYDVVSSLLETNALFRWTEEQQQRPSREQPLRLGRDGFVRDNNEHKNNNAPPGSAAKTTNITTTMRLPGAAFVLGPLWVRPLWAWPCAMGTTEIGIIDLGLNANAEKRARAVCFIA